MSAGSTPKVPAFAMQLPKRAIIALDEPLSPTARAASVDTARSRPGSKEPCDGGPLPAPLQQPVNAMDFLSVIGRLETNVLEQLEAVGQRLDTRFARLESAIIDVTGGSVLFPTLSRGPGGEPVPGDAEETSKTSFDIACSGKASLQVPRSPRAGTPKGPAGRQGGIEWLSKHKTFADSRAKKKTALFLQDEGPGEAPLEAVMSSGTSGPNAVSISSDATPEPVANMGPRLSRSGLTSFRLRPELLVDLTATAGDSAQEEDSVEAMRDAGSMVEAMQSERSTAGKRAVSGGRRWLLNPTSNKRLAWDIIGMLLIAYDVFVIPLQLAFDVPTEGFLMGMFWVSLMYWSTDIFMSFMTGYLHHGAEILDRWRIALHYIRTWLGFDLVVVMSDWFMFLSSGGREAGLARLGKSLRVIRIVRSLRLIRLVKLQKIIDQVLENVDSEYLHIFADMVKGMVFVFGLNHIIACVWYGISMLSSPDSCAWVRKGHFTDRDKLTYRYLTSLHWSITQFTPASMEVMPCNTHERAFAVCVLIFALLVLSSFLSSITAMVTQLRQLSWKHRRQTMLLRKYLRRRFISSGLSMRVLSFVEWKRHADSRELRDSDVVLLGSLSEQLRVEMMQEVCRPTMRGHPFFNRYGARSNVAMGRVCSQAIRRFSLSVDDVVFDAGVVADSMIFLLSGRMLYDLNRQGGPGGAGGASGASRSFQESPKSDGEAFGGSEDSPDDSIEMGVGEWCSEAALWTFWVHVGSLQAQGHSEVLALDAQKFLEITARDQNVIQTSVKYSTLFVQLLNESVEDGVLSDFFPSRASNQVHSRTNAVGSSRFDIVRNFVRTRFSSSSQSSGGGRRASTGTCPNIAVGSPPPTPSARCASV